MQTLKIKKKEGNICTPLAIAEDWSTLQRICNIDWLSQYVAYGQRIDQNVLMGSHLKHLFFFSDHDFLMLELWSSTQD